MKIDVLIMGELLADFISEELVTHLHEAESFRMYQGGSPANVCANLHWQGANAILASCVGQDNVGKFLVDSIKSLGLNADYIFEVNEPTTIVLVGRSHSTPDFSAYRMADTKLPPIPQELIADSQVLHSSAFALSREPAQGNILAAFHNAVALDKKISVDWNFAPQLWLDDGKKVFEELCAMKPLLKVSLDDLERFLNRSLTLEEAKTFMSGYHTTLTCLTAGKDGVWYQVDAGEWIHQPAIAVKEVKDVTGAGDAFWSGVLYAYIRQNNFHDCVVRGLNLAALKIKNVGPLYQNYKEPPSISIESSSKF